MNTKLKPKDVYETWHVKFHESYRYREHPYLGYVDPEFLYTFRTLKDVPQMDVMRFLSVYTVWDYESLHRRDAAMTFLKHELYAGTRILINVIPDMGKMAMGKLARKRLSQANKLMENICPTHRKGVENDIRKLEVYA